MKSEERPGDDTMNFYDGFMKGFEESSLKRERKKLIPRAHGNVLEIGAGTGANLKYYDFKKIKTLELTDRVIKNSLLQNLKKMEDKEKIKTRNIDVISLPYPDKVFDTVVFTLVFCSVVDVSMGIREVKRVLKDDGEVVFIEHVLPENVPLKYMFNFINPAWKIMANGCNLNRNFIHSFEEEEFKIKCLNKFGITVFISGCAVKAKV